MNQLQREAIAITKELGDVVFVGAVAVLSYIGWRQRKTKDVDIAMVTKLTKEQLEQLGYRTFQEGGKNVVRSPRGYKVDIYTNDVSNISIKTVYGTAREVALTDYTIKVASLEVLLLAKLRAMRPSRPQDREDFNKMCEKNGKSIDWEVLIEIASEIEVLRIRETVRALAE